MSFRPVGTELEEVEIRIPPSLQDGFVIYDLPVVETTGSITLSLRDKDNGHVPTWRPDYLSSFYPSYFRHSGLERSPNPRDFSRF